MFLFKNINNIIIFFESHIIFKSNFINKYFTIISIVY